MATREKINAADFSHTVRFDAVDAVWEVVDPSGEVVQTCETKEEAKDAAIEYKTIAIDAERQRIEDEYQAACEEEAETEKADLIASIADSLDGMELTELRKLARKLGV